MSDRKRVIYQKLKRGDDRIELFMDGETGTWRLFLDGENASSYSNVDFSLYDLVSFHDALGKVLEEIKNYPEGNNAEVRSTWVDS